MWINMMLQTDRLDEAQKDLGGLDRKVQEQAAKVKRAEEEVAKTTADLESLPPPPEGVNDKKADLQRQVRELDMQVRFGHIFARSVVCCTHLAQLCWCYLYCLWMINLYSFIMQQCKLEALSVYMPAVFQTLVS